MRTRHYNIRSKDHIERNNLLIRGYYYMLKDNWDMTLENTAMELIFSIFYGSQVHIFLLPTVELILEVSIESLKVSVPPTFKKKLVNYTFWAIAICTSVIFKRKLLFKNITQTLKFALPTTFH